MIASRSRRRALGLMAATALATLAAPHPLALADLRIDITRGQVQPLPIAITDFYGADPRDGDAGANVTRVVSADLERSGLFQPIDPKAFIQTPQSLLTQVRFADWRLINAQ